MFRSGGFISQSTLQQCKIGSHHAINTSKTFEVVLTQLLESNGLQEVFLPALDTSINTCGHKTLFANNTAKAPVFVASRHVRQSVSQVIEFALGKLLFGHVVLQPEGFRNFHFNTHLTTDIAQAVVLGCVDFLGLLNWAMVKPKDNVAVVAVFVVEVWSSDAHRFVSLAVEDSKGTSSVKADTANGVRIHVVLVHGGVD